MPTVRVRRTVRASVDQVFDLLTDHANYKRFRFVRDSELVREGQAERNGVGALRRVLIGPIRFEEEITTFERPVRMDYLIRDINAPLEHEGGTVALEATGEGTEVLWSSTFRVPMRLIGGVAGSAAAPLVRVGFASILKDVAARLEE